MQCFLELVHQQDISHISLEGHLSSSQAIPGEAQEDRMHNQVTLAIELPSTTAQEMMIEKIDATISIKKTMVITIEETTTVETIGIIGIGRIGIETTEIGTTGEMIDVEMTDLTTEAETEETTATADHLGQIRILNQKLIILFRDFFKKKSIDKIS